MRMIARGIPESKIAAHYKVSRQRINQIKNDAAKSIA